MDLKHAIAQFLEHLEIEKNRSHNTLENYAFYLRRFRDWASKKRVHTVEKITEATIRDYGIWLSTLNDDRPLKKTTQNYHLIALRSFLTYLAEQNIPSLTAQSIQLIKTPERSVTHLSGDELDVFLSAPSRTDDAELVRARDRAILELLFCTGLRVSELATLPRSIVTNAKDELMIRGVGDKYRTVVFTNRAREHVHAYLAFRTDAFAPLFIRHDRAFNPRQKHSDSDLYLTPRSIQRMIQKYERLSGMKKKITPNVLRHSFATDLLMNGSDLKTVQTLLGHAHIANTQIYSELLKHEQVTKHPTH